jgi:hypothetical protein
VRMRVRLRGTCGDGHGAVPAWAGCLMILGLYPDWRVSLPPAGTPIHDTQISCAARHGVFALALTGSRTRR